MHEQRRISKTHGSEGETLAIALDDVKGLLRSVATWDDDEALETLIEDYGFVVYIHLLEGKSCLSQPRRI